MAPSPTADTVVRLSVGSIIFGIVVIVACGFAGGLLAQQFFRAPLPPLTSETDRLVSTVQEVTISPNIAAADNVGRANRSIFLLSRSPEATPVATGFVVTNDGVLVSTADITTPSPIAFDQEGRALALARIGRDELYGLTYYRLANNVVVPLDLRQTDPPVGYELLSLSRNETTYLPRTIEFRVGEYTLPTNLAPAIVRVMRGSSNDESAVGSALIDDEGKVAGILQSEAGIAYPVSHLQASLARFTSNQREADVFAAAGLTLTYTFQTVLPQQTTSFHPQIAAVTANSPADIAGLLRGDVITAIKDEPITWERPVAAQLSAALPLSITIVRNGASQTVTLPAAPAASPNPTTR